MNSHFETESYPDFHVNAIGGHTITDCVVTNPRLAVSAPLELAITNHLRSWANHVPPSIWPEAFAWADIRKSII